MEVRVFGFFDLLGVGWGLVGRVLRWFFKIFVFKVRIFF